MLLDVSACYSKLGGCTFVAAALVRRCIFFVFVRALRFLEIRNGVSRVRDV